MTTASQPDFVQPVAPSTTKRERAPRIATLEGHSIGLVDSMLNRHSGWGQGILDAAEDELRQRWPRIDIDRIARPQLGIHEPDRWAAAMAAKYAAIVIAVGD